MPTVGSSTVVVTGNGVERNFDGVLVLGVLTPSSQFALLTGDISPESASVRQ